jgi:predicted enzyme related to lactoylglutathione lyase
MIVRSNYLVGVSNLKEAWHVSERDGYQPGVPCWVELMVSDPAATMQFYGGLFGWEFAGPGRTPGDPPGQYFVARLRDAEVAGVGSPPGARVTPEPAPAWSTHIAVENLETALARAEDAGAEALEGPLEAPPAGRLAVLRDPTGAVFCLWQAHARAGAQLVNEPSAWAMSLLHTTDPDRARAFYSEVFGWRAEAFETGEATVTLWRLPGYVGGEPAQPVPRDVVAAMVPAGAGGDPAEARSQWNVDFWIEDADRAAERAGALGGTVVAGPFDAPGFRTAVLADPHGAAFSVSTLNMA